MTAVPTLSARVLLEVEHGSHLYGLSHPGSDRDRYIVLADRPAGARGKYRWATHRVHGADDVFTCDLHTFIDMAYNGVPQALEAMFAPAFETDEIAALRAGFRAGGGTVIGTYRRTIRNFAVGDFKRQRHALRLALNLAELMGTGRFSPRLTPGYAHLLTRVAETGGPVYERFLRQQCPVDLGDLTHDTKGQCDAAAANA